MSLTTELPKKKSIEPGTPLVCIDSVNFWNSSLDNFAWNLGKNNIYHLSQDFNGNKLDLIKNKNFFSLYLQG